MPGYIGGSIKERAHAALAAEPKFRPRSREPVRPGMERMKDESREFVEISTQTTDYCRHSSVHTSLPQYPSMGSPGYRADQMLSYPRRAVNHGGFYVAAFVVVVIVVIYLIASYNYFFFRLEFGAVGLE